MPVDLTDGLATIKVQYRHHQGQAHLAIDRRGPNFRRESLSVRFLTHNPDEDEAMPHPNLFETGRRRADRLGCANCQTVLDLPEHPHLGSDLADAARAIDPDWLNA